MKATLFSLVFAAGALAQNFMINTPANAVVCQPLLLTWTGGTPPYFLSILPGGQPSAPALVDLGRQDGTSITWTVNQPQGTSLGLTLRDSNGQIAQSAPFTVNGGSDTSCVGQNPSASAGGAAPSSGGGASSAPGTAGTTAPATTSAVTSAAGATTPATTSAAATSAISRPATTATSASRSSSAASAAASNTSNAASANLASVGAGVVGAALAALLA